MRVVVAQTITIMCMFSHIMCVSLVRRRVILSCQICPYFLCVVVELSDTLKDMVFFMNKLIEVALLRKVCTFFVC